MTGRTELRSRSHKATLVAAVAGVITLAFGAGSAFSETSPPPAATFASSTAAGISIVELERIGSDHDFVTGPLPAAVGEVAHFKIAIANRGSVPLEITLSDPMCDAGTLGPRGVVRSVSAGKSTAFYCSHLLVSDDTGWFGNIATSTGTTAAGVSAGPVGSRALVEVDESGVLGARKVVVRQNVERPMSKKVQHLSPLQGSRLS
jgi:hypothetical protein